MFRENPRADDDRSSGSGLLSMLAMGLAYQVQTQDSLKGHTQRELGSAGMETVFNGGILVPECISVESLNRDGQHAPCIVVKDPVTNQLYGREISINTSNTAKTGAAVVSSQTLRQTSNYDEKSDGIVGNRASLYTSDVNTYDLQTYCAEPIIHRDAPSSSCAINHRDNISNQNSNVNQSPDKKVTRAAPVAWTVEVEPRREKDEDSARAGEGRLSRRSSFRQSRSTAETAPDIKSDVNASKVKNPTLPSSDQNQRSSPNTAASKSVASKVAESTVNYRVDSTSGARSDESKYVADELSIGQSPYEGREMRSSVIYQTDCPLRCVSMLSDDYGPSQQLSSSWMFAMGSNDKSVKIARVSDTASNQPPIVEIVREFSDVHRGSIYAMDWSSPGQGQGQGQGGLLATASNDKAVRILK